MSSEKEKSLPDVVQDFLVNVLAALLIAVCVVLVVTKLDGSSSTYRSPGILRPLTDAKPVERTPPSHPTVRGDLVLSLNGQVCGYFRVEGTIAMAPGEGGTGKGTLFDYCPAVVVAKPGVLYRVNTPEASSSITATAPKIATFFARSGSGPLKLIEWAGQYEYVFRQPGHRWPDEDPKLKHELFKYRLCRKSC